eukprot:COSAG04_NODE_12304_length_659_cov_0.776786_2_plen_64_part_00
MPPRPQDFVLLTIPHTPETEGLFDASKFALMKSSAVFVNVGRGATTKLVRTPPSSHKHALLDR